MNQILWAWAISAVLLCLFAIGLGQVVGPGRGVLGILIDERGRFSLTHFQLVAWTVVVLSLISGVFWGRLIDGVADPLSFSIPDQVLGLLGITLGSSVAATAVKSAKDDMAGERVAASNPKDRPRFAQIFLLEEGTYADKVVDITKFQNFIITLVLVVAYIGLAMQAIDDAESAATVAALPSFSGTFVTLLGISHAAYVAGKLPSQNGEPPGLTVKNRTSAAPDELPAGVTPRNPG